MRSFLYISLLFNLFTLPSGILAMETNIPDSVYKHTEENNKNIFADTILHTPKHRKLKAAVLALTLGHFGAHRIYLSTHPRVPAAYSATLGGGLGILPLIDFFTIVFTKDISRYQNSSRFFMWQDKPVKSITQP